MEGKHYAKSETFLVRFGGSRSHFHPYSWFLCESSSALFSSIMLNPYNHIEHESHQAMTAMHTIQVSAIYNKLCYSVTIHNCIHRPFFCVAIGREKKMCNML